MRTEKTILDLKNMKKILLLLILAFTSLYVNAQDKMTFTSGKSLYIKVIEISATDVKYRMFDDLQGPIYQEKLSNIYYIKFYNGEMRLFNQNPARINNYTGYTVPYQTYSKPPRKSSYNRSTNVNPERTSGITGQVDLYLQNAWGVGFMIRKEINQYLGWNLIGASYMSGWYGSFFANNFETYHMAAPDKFGMLNVRLCGIRLNMPLYEYFRFYAEVTPGYTFAYFKENYDDVYENINLRQHFFGFDFGAGLQLHKNVSIGYNLNFRINSDFKKITHWGKISFLF